MGRLPDNYLGPKQRIQMLKSDYPKTASAITTDANMVTVGDTLVVMIKASIAVEDKVIATGHAFTGCPEDDKAVEKAETIAIGRALVNAGYPELLEEDEADTEEKPTTKTKTVPAKEVDSEEKPKKSSGLGGKLGVSKPKVEVEKDEEDESAPEEAEEIKTEEVEEPKKLSREELLAKYKTKK